MIPLTKRRSSASIINGGGEGTKQELTHLIPIVGDTSNNQIDNNSTNKSTTKKTKTMVLFGATIMVLIGAIAIASKNSLVFAAVMGGSVVATNGVKIKCRKQYMPDLTSPIFYRYSRICYPDDGKKYPLHFFAHGDFGGGPFSFAYDPLIKDIVSQGFVVSMYLSCSADQFCNNGQTSFLEVLKSMSYLENYSSDSWWNDIIDFNLGYTASGHSTGARVVLQLAALKDNPTKYLMGQPDIVSQITPEQRVGIQKFKAFIADHPDPMYDGSMNPDVTNFKVTSTPILIITGSKDIIEPELSAWKDFTMITSPSKVYIDIDGARHVSPIFSHTEGPYIGYFSQCFIDPDSDIGKIGCENIYGKKGSPDSMRNVLSITPIGGRNTGNGKVGYLGCGGGIGISDDVPEEFAQYCKTLYKE